MCPYKTEHNSFKIYEVFSLPVQCSNLSAEYKFNYKYIRMTYDQTKTVAITDLQYRTFQHPNRQFCRINAPFQPLANLPSCVTALYDKKDQVVKEQCSLVISHIPCTFVPIAVTSNLWIIPSNSQTLGLSMTTICPDKATSTVHLQQPFYILRLSPACSTTSRCFHMAPHYEDHSMVMNVSLDIANINAINISTLDFRTPPTEVCKYP